MASIGVTATVAAAIIVAPASTAAAHAGCGTTVGDRDNSTWVYSAAGANMRQGSGTHCNSNGVAYASHRLDYHCYTIGNDGYTWTYVRNDTTGATGWIRDNLLADYGSGVYCGF
ncbi:SH3 domain-containing protein [Streptomyces sp. DSM 44915]|uniref:SH3 domain-containing protein n=1 Tax=Streptomyces chisholmiae TaxID=3075540 RepID=A0ABU2JZV3_9ACTN|nr:SH3 domain-containing protein [Streptomyces sp. DSM 44915]MDT0270298.1 SH3 domain-containing protein [Streptomyces sp. DSM 44915]